MNEPLAQIFRYNKWANTTLLSACRDLGDHALDAQIRGGSGPVREVLTHIVGGEQTFILRTIGRQHEGELNRKSAWVGVDRLLDMATACGDELVQIAEDLTIDMNVDLPYEGKAYRYPKSFFLLHAAEHGAEHRSEVKLMLASIGISTPDLDGWAYGAAAGMGAEV